MGFKIISLAGYTSAGKTTLFNKMTGEKTRVESKMNYSQHFQLQHVEF